MFPVGLHVLTLSLKFDPVISASNINDAQKAGYTVQCIYSGLVYIISGFFILLGFPYEHVQCIVVYNLQSSFNFKYEHLQSTLPKSNLHKSNNRPSRRSIQVLFSLYSIVFNPTMCLELATQKRWRCYVFPNSTGGN